jgi:L-ribulokinase
MYTFGIDFGTDSVRAVLVNALNGDEIAVAVQEYPRWKAALYCDPTLDQYRQHPLDYIESMELAIKQCVQTIGPSNAHQIVGLSIDTTASTPIAVDRTGMPLSLNPEFSENPNALFVLWKDHTANNEAVEINEHAKKFETNYLKYVGGIYSPEWFWSKILYINRIDPKIRATAFTWVEHCDWIPFLLTGGTDATQIIRSVCTAGHKALWAEEFGGFPPNEFFKRLDPSLDGLVDTFKGPVADAATAVGTLSVTWANRLGLSTEVKVGVGMIDCHMGAVGGQIEPYYLSKVIGTSTCDILIAPAKDLTSVLIPGICGQVTGSVVPNFIGLEAGQAAFGDIYAWFKNLLLWPVKNIKLQGTNEIHDQLLRELESRLLKTLSEEASNIPLTEDLEWAVDWWNGRRTPFADAFQKGSIHALRLGSDPVRIFRALVEATLFGSKNIVEHYIAKGIPIKGIIALGGISRKSDFIMQAMADILNMPIKVHRSEQTCALGGAMYAATIAGIYPSIEEAMEAMGQGFDKSYQPNMEHHKIYEARYKKYKMHFENSLNL